MVNLLADVKFRAFVEDVIRDRHGVPFVLKTAETHSRKDPETGKYRTEARTFRDVKAGEGVDLSPYSKGDRVTVTGTEKTVARESDGKTFYTLTVWADSVSPDQYVPRQSTPADDEDTPF